MLETPPLWFTESSARYLMTVARRQVRRISTRFSLGEINAWQWQNQVFRAVGPAVASVARLSRGHCLDDADRRELASRLSAIAGAADAVSQTLVPESSPVAAALAIADSVRHTRVTFSRASAWDRGAIWERRVSGPGCPVVCRRAERAGWSLAGQLPETGDYPGCRCRMEFAFDFVPPELPQPSPRVYFRKWTPEELAALSLEDLRKLSPHDAADALASLGDDVSDDRSAILESVATPKTGASYESGLHRPRFESEANPGPDFNPLQPGEAGWPPNPAGNHFSDDAEGGWEASLLPHLIAAYDSEHGLPAVVAASLLKAAARVNATSQLAYSVGRSDSGVKYDPSRASLHSRVAASLCDNRPRAASPPQATVVIGRPSTEFAVGPKPADVIISLASLASQLPEYQGWNHTLLVAEAADIAAATIRKAVGAGQNVHLNLSGCTDATAGEFAAILSRAGYEVHAVLTECSGSLSAMRTAERFRANPFGTSDPQRPAAYFSRADCESGDVDGQARDLRNCPGLSTWKAS